MGWQRGKSLEKIFGMRKCAKVGLAAKPLVDHIEQLSPDLLKGDLIQPDHPFFGVIWINRARVSGAPCFYGTRVPITTLFNCISANQTIEEFLEDFEGVTREPADAVLKLAQSQLLSDLPKP